MATPDLPARPDPRRSRVARAARAPRTRALAPEARGLHEMFEDQARRRPDAPALVDRGRSLTYARLNARANRLARGLVARGVGRETRVGIHLERSADVVVGVLAVLKAGGAYVPVDPAYPATRVAFTLRDAGVALVLTDDALGARLQDSGVPCVSQARAEDEQAGADASDLGLAALPRQLAYVIYTSGSTGTPKGTLVEHDQVTRLFTSTRHWFAFGPDDVWTLFHSYAFDFSVWELWGALLFGGTLVVVPAEVGRSPEAFHDLLRRERVTVLNQTPSAFRQLDLVDAARPGTELRLRVVVFGGEALDRPSVLSWMARHGDRRPLLVNMYGITETTVHVTYEPLTRAAVEAAARGATPVGAPIPDLRVHLLDGALREVPAGETGEIYVGGAGVSRGYGGRAALTASRFLPDPFAPDGGRLYRSGDLARRAPDGSLHYLGRGDAQVKVRGFRVELGEIEVALCRHPQVRAGVVVARDDGAGEKRLVAYVVPAEPRPTWSDVRAHLAATLPEALLPHAMVTLDALPLTAHGKLDREALPQPSERPELEPAYLAPATPAEQALCEVWQQVLELPQVGVDDNFFELGGDSIRSLQVVSLAGERGLRVTLEQMFQHQTVRQLARALAGEGEGTPAASGVAPFSMLSEADRSRVPADAEDVYPLTAVQAGLIFHSESDPHYVVWAVSVRVREVFDEAAFRRALEHLVRRHPLLRTTYDTTTYSEPMQVVHRAAPVPLQVEDLRALDKAGRDRFLADWIEREKRTKFDWGAAPLVRVTLHRLDEQTFQFTFTHSLLDGWSTASVTTELFRFYAALVDGRQPPDDAPLTHYREFVAREREALASPECRAFWRGRLAGEPRAALPRWPATPQGSLPVRRTSRIPPPVVDALFRLAKDLHVPIKSVFVAAHLRVLSLVTGERDVVAGVINNGRVDGPQTEQVLGMFLNTPPLRLRFPGGTWSELVREVFAAEQELLPYRRYPYAELQAERGRQPLFEAAFNIINFHVYREFVRSSGLQVLERLTSYDQTFFPLTAYFEVDAFSTDAFLHLDLNTRDIGDEQLAALEGHYQMVMAAMAADPSARYDRTALLLDAERELLLDTRGRTRAELPGACVHELFAQVAAERPGRVAVRDSARALTYAELDRRAERLAERLAARGAGPDTLVAVCTERSVDMLVALLGVLKAGAAYLPLDPALPAERLEFMLKDGGARAMVTQRGLIPRLPAGGPVALLLDDDADDLPAADVTARRRAGLSNLAYVIYTSGSTGTPKGVQIEHRALVNLLASAAREPGFGPDDVLLALTTLSFDIAALELFLPLTRGGCVVVGEHRDTAPEELQRQIAESGASVVQATPTTWRLLVESGWAGDGRLTLLCGGEPLPRDLAGALLARCGALWNMYGPTETTIWSTCGRVRAEPGAVPVGRPMANTRAYVLDADLQPVPVGAGGSLWLAGGGLARGYVARPGLTAERFRPDPFCGQPGARMYLTGDLAQVRPDGVLELLGRSDQQVKVRGFRIEPGEIEAALMAHPDVRQAAVVAREYGPGDVRLLAFVTPTNGSLPAADELRRGLKARLPDYMLPAAYVPLERLPLTANGKLDRRALLALDPGQATPAAAGVAPRTPLERRLAEIWEAVLDVRGVGAHQDFFELGGHSLLAMRVISRLRADLGLPVPATALFDAPSIAALAALVESLQADEDARLDDLLGQVEALSDEEVEARLFASHPASGPA